MADGIPERETDGPVVLCATSVGGHAVARTVDGIVATALWLRGAQPNFLLCDETLPACELCTYTAFSSVDEFIRNGPKARLCASCFSAGVASYGPLPIPLHRYREFISDAEIIEASGKTSAMSLDDCFLLDKDGLNLGEQVRASTIRFFGKADLTSEDPHLLSETARRYAAAAIVTATVGMRAIDHLKPDVLVCHHGVYVPQGVLGEVARQRGIHVVNWGPSYRDRTVIYSHNDTYHRTLLDEETGVWDSPLSEAQEDQLLTFLAERRRGKGDWVWVTPEAALRPEEQERHELTDVLGLDPSLPTFGLLTNVLWDAQLYYEGNAFEHMLEWLYFTVDHFAAHPDRQLLVRIHPHEVKAGNRQPVGPELARRYPAMPPNVFVVPHDSPLNTYALMKLCRLVLIYGTKTGVELTPLGQPVIVAADAWIRGKGLTIDPSSKKDYERLLDDLLTIDQLDETTTSRARRYAYHYFFRRMIPLSSLAAGSSDIRLDIASLEDLRPGHDRGLDVICDGIINGSPFLFNG